MTIRRRLILSFATILALFGLNLAVYAWGNYQRGAAVENLRRAGSKQLVVSHLEKNLQNVLDQVRVLSEGVTDLNQGSARPEEVEQFKTQLAVIATLTRDLRKLTDPRDQ